MLKRLKRGTLATLRNTGVFRAALDSAWRRNRLLILCYHGISINDEHEWDPAYCVEINEPRLLATVQKQVGGQVQRLYSPPVAPDAAFQGNPFDESWLIGVPVASFPRWVVCPSCRLLAPLGSGLFSLKADPYRPDRTRYVHQNCSRGGKRPPTVNPARFLVACERGHPHPGRRQLNACNLLGLESGTRHRSGGDPAPLPTVLRGAPGGHGRRGRGRAGNGGRYGHGVASSEQPYQQDQDQEGGTTVH